MAQEEEKESTDRKLESINLMLSFAREHNLECEVVMYAMQHIKENPESTIEEACVQGLNEWDI